MDARAGKLKYYFCRALRKYGVSAFSVQELASGLSEEQADNLERVWIILLQSHLSDFGYNLTLGGEGYRVSQETRQRIGLAHRNPNIKDEEIIPLYNCGLSCRETAARIGIGERTVSRRLRRAGIRLRAQRDPNIRDEELISLYNEGLTTAEIATQIGQSSNGVRYRLLCAGITLRPAGPRPGIKVKDNNPNYRKDISNKEIASLYGKGWSMAAIGRRLDTTATLVHRRLRRAGIHSRPIEQRRGRCTRENGPCYRKDVSTEEIIHLRSLGLSAKEIGKRLGVHRSTVFDRCRQARIKSKSSSSFSSQQPPRKPKHQKDKSDSR